MKYNIGDKVKFLNDVGGGVISKIISTTMVCVTTNEGFDMPVLVSDLIPDGEEVTKTGLVQPEQPEEQVSAEINNFEPDYFGSLSGDSSAGNEILIKLGFVPESKNLNRSKIELYIINESSFHLLYLIGTYLSGHFEPLHSGFLESDTKVAVATLDQTMLSQINKIAMQALFVKKTLYELPSPLYQEIDVSKLRFYTSATYCSNDYFDEVAYIVDVASNKKPEQDIAFNEKLCDDNKQESKNKKPEKNTNTDLREIDLHIHELVENSGELSNHKKLEIQLNYFKEELNVAMEEGIKKIVFIHGVGNGRLKFEILKLLDEQYMHLKYQDASFREYGYGATMIYL